MELVPRDFGGYSEVFCYSKGLKIKKFVSSRVTGIRLRGGYNIELRNHEE